MNVITSIVAYTRFQNLYRGNKEFVDWTRSPERPASHEIILPFRFLCHVSFNVHFASIDFTCARDAAVCVITVGSQSREDQAPADYLEHNLKIFKDIIPNVCKYAPNSILLILSKPGTVCACYICNALPESGRFFRQIGIRATIKRVDPCLLAHFSTLARSDFRRCRNRRVDNGFSRKHDQMLTIPIFYPQSTSCATRP